MRDHPAGAMISWLSGFPGISIYIYMHIYIYIWGANMKPTTNNQLSGFLWASRPSQACLAGAETTGHWELKYPFLLVNAIQYLSTITGASRTQGASGKLSNNPVVLRHWLAATAPICTGPFTTVSALAALVLMALSSAPGNDRHTKIAAKEHFAAVMPTRLSNERKSCGESVATVAEEN